MKFKSALIFLSALTASATAQLITNADFETSIGSGWSSIQGLAFIYYQNSRVTGITNPQSGDYYVVLGLSSSEGGKISQTVTLAPNTAYTLTGYANTTTKTFAAESGVGSPFFVDVFDNTNNISFGNADGIFTEDNNWRQFSLSFNSGNSTNATINLAESSSNNNFVGVAFDNITLTAVPEASTALFGGLSIIGLALRRRRG
jgi:Protein of unknown function (DUF642)